MKIRITKAGCQGKDGKPLDVGTELDVDGDTMPASYVNKAEEVKAKKAEKTAVTNPAMKPLGGTASATKKDA